jgi:ABC-2 type transport system ATP-binding protein
MMTNMTSKPINISIHDVSKSYQRKVAIDHISTEFEAGQLHLLIGKNGSGKSTLMKCIMKLIDYKGDIIKKRYRIGYAPEKYIMPEFMTIYQFLKTIGRIKDLYEPYLNLELMEYLKIFLIDDRIHDRIKQLSNGMKQKVNLVQALINHPKIILLDEPLVGLDEKSQKSLIKKLIELSKERLVIISTHHPHKFQTSRKMIHQFDQGRLL